MKFSPPNTGGSLVISRRRKEKVNAFKDLADRPKHAEADEGECARRKPSANHTLGLTMTSEDALDKASELMGILDLKLDGLKVKDSASARVSSALLHLSLEHFGAIVVLLQSRLNGSAAALVRLQYEAMIRGMYFYQCASESEAEKFFAGAEPPRVKEMIEALEQKPGFTSGVFSRVHLREWRTLNSYTHGGSAQLSRRYLGGDLANHYSESDRLDIIKAARGMALIAATHAAIGCDSIAVAQELMELSAD